MTDINPSTNQVHPSKHNKTGHPLKKKKTGHYQKH